MFKDASFNAVDWINQCYDDSLATSTSSRSDIDKESFVSNLVAQLETLVQSVNLSLERTSDQVVATMPQVFQRVQDLRAEAVTLQRDMAAVQGEIARVQRDTGSCMASLERLDRLRVRLQVARQGLQESDGWGRLTAQLEDLFEQGDLEGACEKVRVLQGSLAAQEGLPGQAERAAEVEEAQNKLEALASPQVVRAFTAGDVEQARRFVALFGRVGRDQQLRQYYRTVQRSAWLRVWTECVDGQRTRFLRDFYENLLDAWARQAKWCAQVFGAQDEEATRVLVDTLQRLEPTREVAIAQALKRAEDKLEYLREVSGANVFLGEQLQGTVVASGCGGGKWRGALCRATYDHFSCFVVQYPGWEQQWLGGQLVQLGLNEAVASDSIRVLGNSNAKVVQWLRESLRRCEGITQGCAVAQLVTVISVSGILFSVQLGCLDLNYWRESN